MDRLFFFYIPPQTRFPLAAALWAVVLNVALLVIYTAAITLTINALI